MIGTYAKVFKNAGTVGSISVSRDGTGVNDLSDGPPASIGPPGQSHSLAIIKQLRDIRHAAETNRKMA